LAQAFDVHGYRAMTVVARHATPRHAVAALRRHSRVSCLRLLLADDVVEQRS
jgi:hypothetical protein